MAEELDTSNVTYPNGLALISKADAEIGEKVS